MKLEVPAIPYEKVTDNERNAVFLKAELKATLVISEKKIQKEA